MEVGKLKSYDWVASKNAVSPFDFRIVFPNEDFLLVEVKSTTGKFKRNFHISIKELETAVDDQHYAIYRVYEMGNEEARMRISKNFYKHAVQILDSLKGFPPGVTVDSFSIDPEMLDFGQEIEISRRPEKEVS